MVTSTLVQRSRRSRGRSGAALPGIEIRLVDEAGREPHDQDGGEIHVRGDNLFSGYWPDGADGPDDDGWWATGDVGYLDPTGDLFLVDRLKELVIVSGFNVYPSEVEDVIAELPEVRRGGGHRGRRRRRPARRSSPTCRPDRPAGASDALVDRRAPPLRGAAGPVQAAVG